MVTDQQVRTLRSWLEKEASLTFSAAKAGMDRKTARKYRDDGAVPSGLADPTPERTWRTRPDSFADVGSEVEALLEHGPGWEAKTLFEELQRRYPGRFADGQLRTLQRRLKHWRATQGPDKEVYFEQVHTPGRLAASDFTHMTELGVTIAGQSRALRPAHSVPGNTSVHLPLLSWNDAILTESGSTQSFWSAS